LLFDRTSILRIGTGVGIELRGLRIVFEVTKQLLGYPNTAVLKVYNLSESTRTLLRFPGTRVELLAGYEGSVSRVFLGDLVNVNDVRENPDTVTTIWARDGFTAYANALSSVSFAAGTSLRQVVSKAYTDLKASAATLLQGSSAVPEKKIVSSMAFSGPTVALLNKMGEDHGFIWFIRDNSLVLIPVRASDASVPVVLINRTTGMVGSPTITEIGADVEMLLNPSIQPAGVVQIQSDFARVSLGDLLYRPINKTLGEGLYRVNQVIHRGDTRGNDWSSSITGVKL